jgi:hypothetical protein
LLKRTHRVRRHPLARVGHQQRLQLLGILHVGVKSEVVIPGVQDDRHPVVDAADKLVRVRGHDGTGVDGAVAAVPTLPQPGEGEPPAGLETDVIWSSPG